ncbi:hypothetical protein MYIN104542_13865 [Mycobacterium intermedium]
MESDRGDWASGNTLGPNGSLCHGGGAGTQLLSSPGRSLQ